MATGVLYPACFGSARFCGSLGAAEGGDRNRYAFRDESGHLGLPPEVAALSRQGALALCNVGEREASFSLVALKVTTGHTESTHEVRLAPGALLTLTAND